MSIPDQPATAGDAGEVCGVCKKVADATRKRRAAFSRWILTPKETLFTAMQGKHHRAVWLKNSVILQSSEC